MSAAAPGVIGTVAHYNLLERLDPCGPGDLFRARDTHRGRTVAIRVLPESAASDAAARQALADQARTLIPLSHPNIIALFDAGEHQDRVYVAFEFVKGQPLRAEMAGRPMNPRRALELVIQISDAVAEAHGAGFVHGGLSPDSVMVSAKGHAKIPTFHLASQAGFDASRGEATLHDYESPEELRGERHDDRSDVYSIGAVAYELLTGRRPPVKGASAPSRWNAAVPAEVDAVLLKALAPNPASRYHGAAVLAAELRALMAALDARGVPDDDVATRPASRTSSLVAIAAAVIVLLAAMVAWWMLTTS